MGSDLTTAVFIYKHNYNDDQVRDLTTRDHVWYAMVEREDVFTGLDMPYVVRSGNPQGISGTFARAQANAGPSKGLQFTAFRQPKFSVIVLDIEALRAARDRKGAFFDLVTMETDAILIEHGDSCAFDFYRDRSGVRGQISSISGNTITWVVADSARNFKEGMVCGASTGADGISGARTGTTAVTAIDEVGGTTTFLNVASISGLSPNDFMFRDGDPGTCCEGLEVCTPLVTPVSGDSFRGKDRSSNVTRYAGSRVNDPNSTLEENLGLCAVYISRAGRSHNVDMASVNPVRFWEIARRQNAKVEFDAGGGTANFGFQYIQLHTPAGVIRVYSDPDCPTNRGRLTRGGSMVLRTMGGYPAIVADDGITSLRQSAAMSIESRAASWGNLFQLDPVAQGVVAA